MMISPVAISTFLLFVPAVRCDIASYRNFSTNAYATPKAPTTTFSSSTRGLGEYILAALGASSSVTSNSSSTTAYPRTTGTAPTGFTNSSNPTADFSAHRWFASSPTNTEAMTSVAPSQSTICYSNVPSLCYSDITYSALSVEPTGSGSDYASRCSSAKVSFSSVSSSWNKVHNSLSTQTQVVGATTWKDITYYKDAYTLCDGHARVASSPAVATSSTELIITGQGTTSVITATLGRLFPPPTPVCSILPSDCDPLWTAYDSSLANWEAQKTVSPAATPLITASPIPPPCANSSARAVQSSADAVLTTCGPCTIFGEGVQLVYFPVPTTVSRDMCASTPVSPMTWFDEDVVSIYNGTGSPQTVDPPMETATYNGHTFTSGTAYISISSVWIGNRCQPRLGTPVTDAILAMPSESVLSLRYRQNHFQYFYDIKTVSGYPFNFADMNEPVPYSAYQGQMICEYENSRQCDVIYDNNFNPQLAMPPGIRKLRPEWEQCQMWYGGLYDPPMALQPATAVATATLPAMVAKSSAEPSPTTPVSIASATALYETQGGGQSSSALPQSEGGEDSGSTVSYESDEGDSGATTSHKSDGEGSNSAAADNDGSVPASTTTVAGEASTSTVHVEQSGDGVTNPTSTALEQTNWKASTTTTSATKQTSTTGSAESSGPAAQTGGSTSRYNVMPGLLLAGLFFSHMQGIFY